MNARTTAALFLPCVLLAGATAPRSGDDRETLARDLLALAESKGAKGDYDRALSDYEKLVERYPGTAAARTAEKRVTPNALLGWSDIKRTGDSANRVDVVVMGDGYTLKHLKKSFHPRSEEVVEAFERDDVLAEYLPYFNFIRAGVVSAESNVDGHGREYDTALDAYLTDPDGAAFAAVKVERVKAYLAQLPAHDGFAVAMVKTVALGESRPGVATVGGNARNLEAIVHAWGHGFAGLGDEFTDINQHRFPSGPRPNVSTSEDHVPWQHWIDAREKSVGVYEGASGRVGDLWRPVASNCAMNTSRQFCPVCREAMVLAIYRVVDGIETSKPAPHHRDSDASIAPPLVPTSTDRFEPLVFQVSTLRPDTHDLEVTWWIVPEHRAPRSPGTRLSHEERGKRGKLPEIELAPVHAQRKSKTGTYSFTVDPADHEPGRYRVICRAVDGTRVPGDKHPWVLKDDAGLLESERAWWIELP